MRIPVGNFGFQTPTTSRTQVDIGGVDAIGRGMQQLGNIGMQATADAMAEKRREDEALARAKASNALLDHEIQVKTLATDIESKLTDRSLSYSDAPAAFKAGYAAIEKPKVEGLDPATLETFDKGMKRTEFSGFAHVQQSSEKAKRADFKGQADIALDKLGKLAGMPGGDIEKINTQADTLDPLGRVAYGANWDKAKQDFKDRNWLNHATQRAMESKDNLEAIGQLEKDLTAADGFYAGKLDTDKRNSVLRSVINDRLRIENKIQHNADRMEAAAEKTINEIDRQIASGIPASADMWAAWAGKVKGTAFETDFKQRLTDEAEVQDVLRLPIEQQRAFVQKKEAALLNGGGSVRDKANTDRLKSAVDANLKQLQESPLLFAQNRTGQPVQPLDIAALAQPGGGDAVRENLRDRVASITALQKQYGAQVQMKPFLPQESQFITSALNQANPKQQVELFGTLRMAFGDDTAYMAAMQQIAPDSPVKALAGMLMAKQRKITLEKNWIADDVTSNSGDVAATVLEGENLINKTKGQKSEDGKPLRSLYIPPIKDFENEFAKYVGDAFASRPGALDVAVQSAYAYYVGKSSKTGRLNTDAKDIDGKLLNEALTATLGAPVAYGSGGTVFAPWGMDKGTFKDKVRESFNAEVKARGMPDSTKDQLPALGLRNIGDGSYYITQGRNYLYDGKGQPVTIKVQP
jgi:hypothetical protein